MGPYNGNYFDAGMDNGSVGNATKVQPKQQQPQQPPQQKSATMPQGGSMASSEGLQNSYTGQGFSAGSSFGPWGMLVGALVGNTADMVASYEDVNKQFNALHDAYRENQQNWYTQDHYQQFTPGQRMQFGGNAAHLAKGGIHIKEENRGKFTDAAKRAGMSVQEYASHVLNDPHASETLRKRAQFAKNASKWHHTEGGEIEHVVPADNVEAARALSERSGTSSRTIPGRSSGTSDNVSMGGGDMVSPGEATVSDKALTDMSIVGGFMREQLQQMLYPNAVGRSHKATGGPETSASLTGSSVDLELLAEQSPGRISPILSSITTTPPSGSPMRSNNDPTATSVDKMTLRTQSVAGSPLSGQPKSGGTTVVSDLGDQKAADQTQALIDAAMFTNIGLGVSSLFHNAFSRRDPLPTPQTVQPRLLDLKTGAQKAALDQERARAVATAVYNNRGRQDIGRDLGIVANDQAARTRNAAIIEQERNTEEQANTQLINQYNLANTQALNQFRQQDAMLQEQYRQAKGDAISKSLAAIGDAAGQMVEQKAHDIERRKTDELFREYIGYMRGTNPYFPNY